MAYTRPGDFYEDYIFTASDFNTYVRDNFISAVPDIFTEAGQLARGNGGNSVAPFDGSSYVTKYLYSVNSTLVWHRPYQDFFHEMGDSFSSGSITAPGEVRAGLWDYGSYIKYLNEGLTPISDLAQFNATTDECKIKVAGTYLVTAWVSGFRSNNKVVGFFRCEKNGTIIAEANEWEYDGEGTGNYYFYANLCFIHTFAYNDELTFNHYIYSSGAIETDGSSVWSVPEHNRGFIMLLKAT